MNENSRTKMKHWQLIATVVIGLATVPMLYQNCSEPPLETQQLSSVAASAPFAFDEKIDHLAYMSCSEMPGGYDKDAFFTFKAGGALDGSGVKLRNDFIYAARNLLTSDKVAALAQSPANKDVFMTLGVRSTTHYQGLYQFNDLDYQPQFWGDLTTESIARPLVDNAGVSYLRGFPTQNTSTTFFDTVQLTMTEGVAHDVRNKMRSNETFLGLTYNRTGADKNQALGAQPFSANSVYGRGFKMNFALGFGVLFNSTSNTNSFPTYSANAQSVNGVSIEKGPRRLMTSVSEFNLITGQPESSVWDCKPEWTFIIVKSRGDLETKIKCRSLNAAPANAAQTEMLTVLRRMLPSSTWEVDLVNRCLVPKTGVNNTCYGTGSVVVDYDGGTCDRTINACPHYVSICKKR